MALQHRIERLERAGRVGTAADAVEPVVYCLPEKDPIDGDDTQPGPREGRVSRVPGGRAALVTYPLGATEEEVAQLVSRAKATNAEP